MAGGYVLLWMLVACPVIDGDKSAGSSLDNACVSKIGAAGGRHGANQEHPSSPLREQVLEPFHHHSFGLRIHRNGLWRAPSTSDHVVPRRRRKGAGAPEPLLDGNDGAVGQVRSFPFVTSHTRRQSGLYCREPVRFHRRYWITGEGPCGVEPWMSLGEGMCEPAGANLMMWKRLVRSGTLAASGWVAWTGYERGILS